MNKYLFKFRVQKFIQAFQGPFFTFLPHVHTLQGDCKKCTGTRFLQRTWLPRTWLSSRLFQVGFSLVNYAMLNKRCIIFKFFTCSSKAGMVVLVAKPQEVIKVHVSMFMNVLDIGIESYGHVLGPPKFLFNPEKNKFSRNIRPFFNGLIKNLVKGIKT